MRPASSLVIRYSPLIRKSLPSGPMGMFMRISNPTCSVQNSRLLAGSPRRPPRFRSVKSCRWSSFGDSLLTHADRVPFTSVGIRMATLIDHVWTEISKTVVARSATSQRKASAWWRGSDASDWCAVRTGPAVPKWRLHNPVSGRKGKLRGSLLSTRTAVL